MNSSMFKIVQDIFWVEVKLVKHEDLVKVSGRLFLSFSNSNSTSWELIARWYARNWKMDGPTKSGWVDQMGSSVVLHPTFLGNSLESSIMKDFNKNATQKKPERTVLARKVQTAQKYVQQSTRTEFIELGFFFKCFASSLNCLFLWRILLSSSGCVISRERLTAPRKLSGSYDILWHVSTYSGHILDTFWTHSISFPKLIKEIWVLHGLPSEIDDPVPSFASRWLAAPSCPRQAELSWARAYHEILNSARAHNCMCLILFDSYWWFWYVLRQIDPLIVVVDCWLLLIVFVDGFRKIRYRHAQKILCWTRPECTCSVRMCWGVCISLDSSACCSSIYFVHLCKIASVTVTSHDRFKFEQPVTAKASQTPPV